MDVPQPLREEIVAYINGGGGFNTMEGKQLACRFLSEITGTPLETAWNCNNTQYFAQKIIMDVYNKYK